MNQTNQVTPYGNLTYSQSGQAFTPSDTGQQYYYNKATGEYRTSAPTKTTVIGGTQGSTGVRHQDPTTGMWLDSQGRPWVNADKGKSQNVLEDGWTATKGNLTPQFTATTTLSPAQQAILDQTNGATLNLATLANDRSGFLKDYLGQSIDLSGAPALQGSIGNGYSGNIGGSYSTNIGDGYQTELGGNYSTDLGNDYRTSYANPDDFSADRQRVEDALMQRQQPALDQNRDQLRTQLIAQGLRPGTQAWNSELGRLSQSENDARLATIAAGGQEQSRLVGLSRDAADFNNTSILNRAAFGNQSELAKAQFGNDALTNRFQLQNAASLGQAGFRNDAALNQANFGNQARQQYLQEAYAQRAQPINEITALLSGSQVQNPQFAQTPQTGVGGVDYTGLVNQQYQAKLAASQSAMGGIAGLGAGLLKAVIPAGGLFSDRRLKRDIERIGEKNGYPWYRFKYVWSDEAHEGVMSDDVRAIKPEAVFVHDSGFDMVDYDMIMEAA